MDNANKSGIGIGWQKCISHPLCGMDTSLKKLSCSHDMHTNNSNHESGRYFCRIIILTNKHAIQRVTFYMDDNGPQPQFCARAPMAESFVRVLWKKAPMPFYMHTSLMSTKYISITSVRIELYKNLYCMHLTQNSRNYAKQNNNSPCMERIGWRLGGNTLLYYS